MLLVEIYGSADDLRRQPTVKTAEPKYREEWCEFTDVLYGNASSSKGRCSDAWESGWTTAIGEHQSVCDDVDLMPRSTQAGDVGVTDRLHVATSEPTVEKVNDWEAYRTMDCNRPWRSWYCFYPMFQDQLLIIQPKVSSPKLPKRKKWWLRKI